MFTYQIGAEESNSQLIDKEIVNQESQEDNLKKRPLNCKRCRFCRYYQHQGRRGGCCELLDIVVKGSWSSCAVSKPYFKRE